MTKFFIGVKHDWMVVADIKSNDQLVIEVKWCQRCGTLYRHTPGWYAVDPAPSDICLKLAQEQETA